MQEEPSIQIIKSVKNKFRDQFNDDMFTLKDGTVKTFGELSVQDVLEIRKSRSKKQFPKLLRQLRRMVGRRDKKTIH